MAADRHAFAQLERGDGFLGFGDHRLLPGDLAQFVHRAVHQLGVLRGFAQADVDRNFLDLRHGHHVLVAELLRQRGDHGFLIMLLESCFCHLQFLFALLYPLYPAPRRFFAAIRTRRVDVPAGSSL